MFRAIFGTVVLLFICWMNNQTKAQDIEAEISLFNETIGEEYHLGHKGKILIIDGFREGEQVKQDKVNIYDLDMESLTYSEEEHAVMIRCISELEDCVARVLMRERNKKSYRKRILFAVRTNEFGVEIEGRFRKILTDLRNKY